MTSRDQLPRRQPQRRRRAGPATTPPPTDWGAWLEGDRADDGPGPNGNGANGNGANGHGSNGHGSNGANANGVNGFNGHHGDDRTIVERVTAAELFPGSPTAGRSTGTGAPVPPPGARSRRARSNTSPASPGPPQTPVAPPTRAEPAGFPSATGHVAPADSLDELLAPRSPRRSRRRDAVGLTGRETVSPPGREPRDGSADLWPGPTGPSRTGPSRTGPSASGPSAAGPEASTAPPTAPPATAGSAGQPLTRRQRRQQEEALRLGSAGVDAVPPDPAPTRPAPPELAPPGPAPSGPAPSGPAPSGPAPSGPAPAGRVTERLAGAGPAPAPPSPAGTVPARPGTAPPDPVARPAAAEDVIPAPRRRVPTEDDDAPDDEIPRLAQGLTLPILAAILTVVALSCLVDTSFAPLVALATFSPAVLLGAVPVIALAYRGRRWVTVAVSSAAAVLPWLLVVGYAVPGPGGSPAPADEVRVMTVNARFGEADPTQIVNTVSQQKVDVLVITELTHQLAHDLTPAGLPGLLEARWIDIDAPAAGGIGVWSRFDAKTVKPLQGTRWPAATLTLTTPGGPLDVVAAHVSPPIPGASAAQWREDLTRLRNAAVAAGKVKLVVGDLNATPWHPPFRRLVSSGLRDAADVHGNGLRLTWPAWAPTPVTALDHVLVAGPIDVVAVDTVTIDGTDHRALVVGLKVPGGQKR